ncbi:MAG: DUF1800 domain-containing protein [Acidobacteria bacterium]|nr:DUF1800 domain-containing protein [Acidobacteriota bacterium]
MLISIFSFTGRAESDPDPDSPAPVLLGQRTRGTVLAVSGDGFLKGVPGRGETVFWPGPRNFMTLFVSNLDLLDGEGANSLRVYLYQKSGRTFELESAGLEPVEKNIFALRVRLADRDGFRGQPLADGESIIYLTWRGLVSNALKINLGREGGTIAVPDFLKNVPRAAGSADGRNLVGYRWSGDRTRFLEQATFGPSADADNRIRRIGLRTWLAEQFEAPSPAIPYPVIPQMPVTPPSNCSLTTNPVCYRDRYTMQPLQQWFFKEAFYGSDQLRQRTAWALGQIWVTSGVTVQQSSHLIAYHKILANRAFGNYRDLMADVTLNPAMGYYLDMVTSTKTNPNENYPREILQLFTIGLFRLNQDGTLQRDAQNNPVPTYDQSVVNNFSKVFTGWTYCNSAECPNAVPGIPNYVDPMKLIPENHDLTAKTLLQYPNAVNPTIPACADCTTPEQTAAYADASLNMALDNIFYHPNLPPFISRNLIQQLVTSDPSPAYVQRVADVFVNNGQNQRGDLKAVIRAILLDPEARGSVKTAPRYGKLREPVQLVTNLGRLFPARSWNGQTETDGGVASYMTKMGQTAFYPPTVFNYYPPEYIVPQTTLNAPEFQLLNTTSAIGRTNFLYTLIFEGLAPNATDSLRGTALDLGEAQSFAAADATGNQLLDYLNTKMMHGTLSAEHRAAVLTAVQAVAPTDPALRAKTAVYLLGASSQYQVQR